MNRDKRLQSFKQEGWDMFHFKISGDCINSEDACTLKEFSERITEPMELYDGQLQTIYKEYRELYLCIVPDEDIKVLWQSSFGENDGKIQVFVGTYDALKPEIEKIIRENGYSHMRRDEHFSSESNVAVTYSCNFYDTAPNMGFYFSRHGVLKGFLRSSFIDNDEHEKIHGSIGKLADAEYVLDKEYVVYAYGSEGWKKLSAYYKENFIDNFEYGKSVFYTKL
jgi:hypothetical protein